MVGTLCKKFFSTDGRTGSVNPILGMKNKRFRGAYSNQPLLLILLRKQLWTPYVIQMTSRTETTYWKTLQKVNREPWYFNVCNTAMPLSQAVLKHWQKDAWLQPCVPPVFLGNIVEFRGNPWKEMKVEETGYQGIWVSSWQWKFFSRCWNWIVLSTFLPLYDMNWVTVSQLHGGKEANIFRVDGFINSS